ncbi:MAG: hypothetical protein BRC40_00335 [Cyanobacteria bacterium QH_8_48_120]|nr:MAG: hypothetical protein BRC34_17630 [Cyanobacteria bacterium QH_1_48_107]PSO61149.1 MAG: hypothetical protein BRC35_00540 [Cyanobacteria bacterium QH_10_48_56]PSO62374.1 MAG: hypothetical protein BRC38_16035 [Cyanobacteria bacterium QH_6_48_35]PSO67307.1 MAG: hypothetical protein BRC39_01705 [Cyanobacteria bacterium QH_7_48_89]PSO69842.1 MAG: hypothetical protein BRC37_16790 [Cyanobacteria bacterium QH_3_48_40]PSO71317.1 MAG: hypothetical protein BRC42_08295 [Cyanobacteria bacterium QS_1_
MKHTVKVRIDPNRAQRVSFAKAFGCSL